MTDEERLLPFGLDAADCISCGEDMPSGECPKAQRPCGHHCNHSWTHDACDWCGHVFGEEYEMTPNQIARVVHEANRAVQVEQKDPTIPVSAPWDDTDPETQQSAIEGVIGVQSGNTPEQSHEGWMRFKIENGRTLGPVKNEATKQHPLLVPYDELPSSQRVKDSLCAPCCHRSAPALIGARFLAASRSGLIRRVGYVQSTDPATHAHPVAEWVKA